MTKVQVVVGSLLPEQASEGLSGVLARAAQLFTGDNEGVVLMDAEAAGSVGLPLKAPKANQNVHEVLQMPRAMGWTISNLSAFMTFTNPTQPHVHVAIHPWLDVNKVGWIYDEDIETMAARMRRFSQLTGVSFRATAGVSGVALLRRIPSLPRGQRAPLWTLDMNRLPESVTQFNEPDFNWHSGTGSLAGTALAKFDQNFAYLGSAAQVEVGMSQLMPASWASGVTDPDAFKGWGGYVQIVRPKWVHPFAPDPLGPRPEKVGMLMWVSVPTVRLLLQLADESALSPVDIRRAFLSQSARLLRNWAETVRDALYATQGQEGIHEAFKEMYKRSIGMLGRPGGRVYRPDWQHTIVAHARTMLWSKMWRVGKFHQIWPLRVYFDEVSYPAASITDVESFPLKVGQKLGQFKLKV